jgi:hypothetical protein
MFDIPAGDLTALFWCLYRSCCGLAIAKISNIEWKRFTPGLRDAVYLFKQRNRMSKFAGVRYLARFQTRRAVPLPVDGVVITVMLSSSPEMLKDDFRSVPFQFGNVQPSMWVVIVLSVSLTEYVPK